jgi:hypothetical protein
MLETILGMYQKWRDSASGPEAVQWCENFNTYEEYLEFLKAFSCDMDFQISMRYSEIGIEWGSSQLWYTMNHILVLCQGHIQNGVLNEMFWCFDWL